MKRSVGESVVEVCCREVLWRSVGEESWGRLVEKSFGEECCREVLQNIAVEKCWRKVLGRSVVEKVLGRNGVEKWCREVLERSVEKCCSSQHRQEMPTNALLFEKALFRHFCISIARSSYLVYNLRLFRTTKQTRVRGFHLVLNQLPLH